MNTFPLVLKPQKMNLGHVRNGKKKRKQEERKETKRVRDAQLQSRSASLKFSMSPWRAGITPGAVPSCGWRKSTGEHTLVWWLHVAMCFVCCLQAVVMLVWKHTESRTVWNEGLVMDIPAVHYGAQGLSVMKREGWMLMSEKWEWEVRIENWEWTSQLRSGTVRDAFVRPRSHWHG